MRRWQQYFLLYVPCMKKSGLHKFHTISTIHDWIYWGASFHRNESIQVSLKTNLVCERSSSRILRDLPGWQGQQSFWAELGHGLGVHSGEMQDMLPAWNQETRNTSFHFFAYLSYQIMITQKQITEDGLIITGIIINPTTKATEIQYPLFPHPIALAADESKDIFLTISTPWFQKIWVHNCLAD